MKIHCESKKGVYLCVACCPFVRLNNRKDFLLPFLLELGFELRASLLYHLSQAISLSCFCYFSG
jgi:hypothetical protein